jgi:hypothetical protein
LPDGTLCYLDLKPGKTAAGEHWFSIKIGKPKAAKPVQAAAPVMQSDDSDIPF